MKSVAKKLAENGADEEKVKAFQTGASAYAKKIVGGFKDYDFYTGESMDPDGMWVVSQRYYSQVLTFNRVVLMNYREDGVTPYVIVWKHGLTQMKV